MVEAFDILRVNANPARFDAKKCEAINASHIRLLDPKELAEQLVPFLVRAGLVTDPPTPGQQAAAGGGDAADPGAHLHLVRGRGHAGLPVPADAEILIEPDAGLTADSVRVLDAAEAALRDLPEFGHTDIEAALRTRWSSGSASSRGWRSPRSAPR